MGEVELWDEVIPDRWGRDGRFKSSDDAISISQFFDLLLAAPRIAVDTESNGQDVRDGRGYTVGVSVATRHTNGLVYSHYFPFRHRFGFNYDMGVRGALQRVLEERDLARRPVAYFNSKYDIPALGTLGVQLKENYHFDCLKGSHLLREELPYKRDLDNVAKLWLGYSGKEKSKQFNTIKDKMGWDYIPSEIMFEYAVHDTDVTYRLDEILWPLIVKEGLEDYWNDKLGTIETLIAMENRGVRVNTVLCEREIAHGQLCMEEAQILLGGLNPGSPKDLHTLLIDMLGLPVVKLTKTGKPSFDKYAMEEYEEILERKNDPTAAHILTYRGWQKVTSACYGSYLSHLSPDGRLRTNYKLHGTKTGRLSSSSPNLQQIPKTSTKVWSGQTKRSFLGAEGYTLWEADYSQLEFRLGTAYAGEQALIEVFNDPERDIFDEMCVALGMSRQDTKTQTYSIQYGAGVNRIKNVFGISPQEARARIDNYYRTYPNFKARTKEASALAMSRRKVKLWSGRYRHFEDPRNSAHKAFNSVIQGGAADIVEATMRRLRREVDSNDCRMLLQVHDSVVFEIRDEVAHEYIPEIKRIMEDVEGSTGVDFGVRFATDVHRWGH